MISPPLLIGITLAYLGALFIIASYVERKFTQGKNLINNSLIYTLGLAVYATAWTFYGNIGVSTSSGYLYLATYIGPTLAMIFFRPVFRKLIRIKNEYGITSIADFISTRYNKSFRVGTIATLIAVLGLMPYSALQLRAIFSSFSFVTTGIPSHEFNYIHVATLIAMSLFAIVFGFRHLKQSDNRPGLVMVIAIQSIIKLVAFLAVGIFATFVLNDNFRAILASVKDNPGILAAYETQRPSLSLWISHFILSVCAFMFLPRQFHMGVVENADEKHLRTSVWLLPLYFLLITLFVFPIAATGLLKGFTGNMADYFVLMLPSQAGSDLLTILVFLGGFSAAISMIMVSTISLTTMVSNSIILPITERITFFNFLKRHLVVIRWMAAIGILLLSYYFELLIQAPHILVEIGIISFAAVFQFGPAMIGGLYWQKGNKIGATCGLIGGLSIWTYTSLVPMFAKSGLIHHSLITDGPFGIAWLRPEHLFGITGIDPLASTIILSLAFNLGPYIVCSILFKQEPEEERVAYNYVNIFGGTRFLQHNSEPQKETIDLAAKKQKMISIFGNYFDQEKATKLAQNCIETARLNDKIKISINELVSLNNAVEKTLVGFIGGPAASEALTKESMFSREETEQLSSIYTKIASEMKISPHEFADKINYYLEKERLISTQQEELERLVKERTKELEKTNSEMKRFTDLVVGRELRMMELKKRIRELETK